MSMSMNSIEQQPLNIVTDIQTSGKRKQFEIIQSTYSTTAATTTTPLLSIYEENVSNSRHISDNVPNVNAYDREKDNQSTQTSDDSDESSELFPSHNLNIDNQQYQTTTTTTTINRTNFNNTVETATTTTTTTTNTQLTTRKMFSIYGRELICIFVLIITTYATFQNIPPKFSVIPPAKPFFPKGSIVHDWPTGQLTAAKTKVTQTELSLVLFYAPWCAESQHARHAYEYVARLFYREVHFSAINCWHPGGECRHQYGKVMSWPVLMAYTQTGEAISYNGGRYTNESLIRFIRSLLMPVRRITKQSQLLQTLAGHDAVVTLFAGLPEDDVAYQQYMSAALKNIEKDPAHDVAFTVVTGSGGSGQLHEFGLSRVPSVLLYLWNETLEFPNTTWTQPELTKWIETTVHQISIWINPPGTKSTLLRSYLKRGPSLLLFTPRNVHGSANGGQTDNYNILRQIALEYYNCANFTTNQEWLRDMARKYISHDLIRIQAERNDLIRECQILLKQTKLDRRTSTPEKHSIRNHLSPVSYGTTANLSHRNHCFIGPKQNDDQTCANEAFYGSDKNSKIVTEFSTIGPFTIAANMAAINMAQTSMLNNEFDSRSPKYLQRTYLRKNCELLAIDEQQQQEQQPQPSNNRESKIDIEFDMIAGLGCKINRSLSFFAIDSSTYSIFAERLGVNLLQKPKQTAAIIVDNQNESTFVLDAPITLTRLIEFVYNYANGKLSRFLMKANDDSYNINNNNNNNNYGVGVQANKSTATKFHPIIIDDDLCHNHRLSSNVRTSSMQRWSIPTISSPRLMAKLSKSNKTLIVLFYSSQCALCNLLTHHLLVISNILQRIPNLEFVRIDGDQNDLPWQYTVAKFPTLIAFPANRNAESRIYPATLQVNTSNVLAFCLANLNRPHRIRAMIRVCKMYHRRHDALDSCLMVLRTEIMDSISYSLKQWRFVANRRQREQIIRRLQLLQRFYLHLYRIRGDICDTANVNELDRFMINILNVWTTTTKTATTITTTTPRMLKM